MRDRALDARTRRGDARRKLIVEAVLASAQAGDFRPGLVELRQRTGVPKTSILKLFGSLDLLYRVVAREHAAAIVASTGFTLFAPTTPLSEAATRRLAWTIMVGKPRKLS